MATDLSRYTERVFEDLIDLVEDCNIELPECRYISHCAPPIDCCPSMVFYPLVVENNIELDGVRCDLVDPKVTFCVELWHCVETAELGSGGLSLPEVMKVTGEALGMQDAAYVVYNGLLKVLGDQCDDVDAIRMDCIPEQGGCAGWKITVTTSIGR